jgi:TonB family protein
MAQAISDAKFQRVVVVDFYGPGEGISNLGVTLADRFDENIRKSTVGPMIQDRSQMAAWIKDKNWPLSVFNSIDVTLWVASQLNLDAIIAGNITSSEREYKVEVSLYRADTRQWVKSFDVLSQMSSESKSLATTFPESEYRFDPGIAVAGQNGYSLPTCLSCPAGPYNEDARRHHTQGSVVLTAVIGADGIPGKLTVRQAMPDGLTEVALETVRTWKLSPAIGPDGKPATVQHTIRMTFHFSHTRPNDTKPPKPHH